MQSPLKKKDFWPLIVGTIAAIGIIGSNSTGGITKITRESSETTAATVATAAVHATPTNAARPSGQTTLPGAPAGTAADLDDQGIRLVERTETVKAGEQAGISVIGQPGVTYDIVVAYGKDAGGVSGMEMKQADAEGRVSWQWRVPILSSKGSYTITITGGGQQLTSTIVVT